MRRVKGPLTSTGGECHEKRGACSSKKNQERLWEAPADPTPETHVANRWRSAFGHPRRSLIAGGVASGTPGWWGIVVNTLIAVTIGSNHEKTGKRSKKEEKRLWEAPADSSPETHVANCSHSDFESFLMGDSCWSSIPVTIGANHEKTGKRSKKEEKRL